MQNRRDFLKTAAFAAIGSGLSLQGAFAGEKAPVSFAINQLGLGAKMKLRFFPYELKLKQYLPWPLIRAPPLPMCR